MKPTSQSYRTFLKTINSKSILSYTEWMVWNNTFYNTEDLNESY
ncbi:MAG: hypothetical protein WBG71_06170 [Leeuwenhoekiella sp.]